jgi:phosphatidylinositol-4-phosphate 3-kinase
LLEGEFTDEECQFLWSHRYFVVHKPYALPKLLKSRSFWDYPSLIDIYGLVHLIHRDRSIDEIESLELLLPAFPDMHIRSVAYQILTSRLSSSDLILALPQLLQIIKFDYVDLSPIVKHLLQQCAVDSRLVHQLYWYLRQLLLDEHLHFLRYYHFFMSLLYIIPESFRLELQNEYDLCNHLKRLGSDIKANKSNRTAFLHEQLKEINKEIFQSGQRSCRLPCQFSFMTNSIDISACSIFSSFTLPVKLVFNPVDASGEKYSSIYKIGDDLRVSDSC